jgi:hypothetical protein
MEKVFFDDLHITASIIRGGPGDGRRWSIGRAKVIGIMSR